MALSINGTSGISGVDGSASAPALQGTDSNTGISFASDTVNINTGGILRAKLGEKIAKICRKMRKMRKSLTKKKFDELFLKY